MKIKMPLSAGGFFDLGAAGSDFIGKSPGVKQGERRSTDFEVTFSEVSGSPLGQQKGLRFFICFFKIFHFEDL